MPAPTPRRPGTASLPGVRAVDGVLVVHDGAPWLVRSLDAIAAQTLSLRHLAVVLTGREDALPEDAGRRLADAGIQVHVVEARGARHPKAVLAGLADLQARGALPDPPERAGADPEAELDAASRWVWLLEDDCFPEPDCLHALLREATLSATVAIAGPKYVDAGDPARLVEVGQTVSPTGRRVASPRHGELDQGQHDHRSDVLAVSAGAMLARADALLHLGALDRVFPVAADLDLCWRAHQAGLRVIVVPEAVALDARATTQGLRSRDRMPFAGLGLDDIDARFSRDHVLRERRAWERERRGAVDRAYRRDRRAVRRIALARCPGWLVPWYAVRILLGALLLTAALLLLKRPRAAFAELSDAGAVLTSWRSLGSRRRARRTTVVGGAGLGPLLAPHSRALAGVRDEVYTGLPHLPSVLAPEGGASEGRGGGRPEGLGPPVTVAEPGPVSDEATDLDADDLGARAARHPGLLAVLVAAALAVTAWWPVVRGRGGALLDRGLAGGELRPGTGGSAAAWTRYLTGWDPSGLGSASDAPTWLPLLAAPAWVVEHLPGRAPSSALGVAAALLLLGAIPAATISAYLAGRAATRRPWPRALAALAWALSPALLVGLGEGRVGAAVLGVVLPPLLAGLAGCGQRRPWWPAVGGAVLAASAAAAVAPALLAVVLVLGLVLAARNHGRGRVAGVLVATAPVVLIGPAIASWWHTPGSVLTGPGLASWGGQPRPWHFALLWATAPVTSTETGLLADPSLAASARLLLPLLAAPVVLAGVWGLAVDGRRIGASRVLAVLALLGVAGAAAAPHLVVGQATDAAGRPVPITPWAGAGLLLLTLALLAAALQGVEAIRRAGATRPGASRPGAAQAVRVAGGLLATLVTVTVLTQAAWLTLTRLDRALAVPASQVPAVAQDSAQSALAARYLALDRRGTAMAYRLEPGDPSDVVRDLPKDAGAVEDSALLREVAHALVTDEPSGGRPVADRLADAGVGFVGLAPVDPAVAARLDTTAGLSRLTDVEGDPVWRVTPRSGPSGAAVPVSAVRVQRSDGTPVATVPVRGSGPEVDSDLATSGAGLVLAVAQQRGWAATAQVRADGRALTPRDGELAAYDLPPDTRHVRISTVPAHRTWSIVQGGALALVLLLALPFGVRRGRYAEVVR